MGNSPSRCDTILFKAPEHLPRDQRKTDVDGRGKLGSQTPQTCGRGPLKADLPRLQNGHVPDPLLGQVIRNGGADNSAADDDDL